MSKIVISGPQISSFVERTNPKSKIPTFQKVRPGNVDDVSALKMTATKMIKNSCQLQLFNIYINSSLNYYLKKKI